MKRFKTTVTRTDEYIIEIDENVINEEFMEDFSRYFFDARTLEEHAENIAQYRVRFGEGFIEGYGRPLQNGNRPIWSHEDEKLQEAINIITVREDNDCEVEVEEI